MCQLWEHETGGVVSVSGDYNFDLDEETYFTIIDALRHAQDDAIHSESHRLFMEAEDEFRAQKQTQQNQETDQ